MENNNSLQADEVQALAAIYSDSWTVEDEEHRVYSINIQGKMKEKAVLLQVTMPPEYPKESPPFYEISAPWLKGSQRLHLSAMLDEIYCENAGENILFHWIEKIREYIANQEDLQAEDVVDMVVLDQLIQATSTKQNNCDIKVPLFHGEPLQDRKSTFQAHLAPVVMLEQVKQVLDELLQNRKIASATHNIHAYRICGDTGQPLYQDYDDDGETQAGIRLMHLLQKCFEDSTRNIGKGKKKKGK